MMPISARGCSHEILSEHLWCVDRKRKNRERNVGERKRKEEKELRTKIHYCASVNTHGRDDRNATFCLTYEVYIQLAYVHT